MTEENNNRLHAADLTIEEKARLLSGMGSWHTWDAGGRLPTVSMSDGPHGLRVQAEGSGLANHNSRQATCFPTAAALACSWDPSAAERMAAALSEEAAEQGVNILLGCGVNIKRSPLCGRNFEYFSEDPLLAGRLAAAYLRALEESGTGTSLKHYACNSRETRRMTTNSVVDERALREIYLAAFETAVKEGRPATVMAAYNLVNGQHACANRRLLTEILRQEWGYEGLILSDWGAAVEPVRCLRAGLDLAMPDSCGVHTAAIRKGLESGRVTREELDKAAERVLNFIYTHSEKRAKPRFNPADHSRLARALAAESAVLLKHGEVLPLRTGERILAVGELAVNTRFQGSGSSHICTGPVRSPFNALGGAGCRVDYLTGYRCADPKPDPLLEQEVLAAAPLYDKILVFLGLTDMDETEGADRPHLRLAENQLSLLRQLKPFGSKIAVICFGGAPVELPFAEDVSDILQMYLGGEAVGEACADLLTGAANPCGKLAETWPLRWEDVPCRGFSDAEGETDLFAESVFVGYRYYETFGVPVRYPFGHGLSYTSFAYGNLSAERTGLHSARVRFTVKNTGDRAGAEIAQLYVAPPKGAIPRPALELRGFEKVWLAPGEEKEITLPLEERSFSLWDAERGRFVVTPGEYTVYAAASAEDLRLRVSLTLEGEEVSGPAWFEEPAQPGQAPVFSRQGLAKLFPYQLPVLNRAGEGRSYTAADSFESVCAASAPGRLLQKGLTGVLPLFVKGGRKSTEYAMLRSGLNETPLESLAGLSGGLLKPQWLEGLLKLANRRNKE